MNLVTSSFWAIDFKINGILDLTDTKTQTAMGLNLGLLYGPWDILNKYKITSYSQMVSSYLRGLGYEGFIYESTKDPGKKCVVIFLDNLKMDSYLELHDKTQGVEKRFLRVDGKL